MILDYVKWTDIARIMCVSVRTIYNRRLEFGGPLADDVYSRLSDDDLDRTVARLLACPTESAKSSLWKVCVAEA